MQSTGSKRKQSAASTSRVAKKPKVDKPKVEKEILQVNRSVKTMHHLSKYYTFGIDFTVDLPVEKIISPPADYCHRPMNEAHVKTIIKMMMKAPTHTPQVAEVVVWDRKKGAVELKEKHKELLKDPKFLKTKEFWAISGQHSSAAQKLVCEKAKENAAWKDLAERHQYRKCKIISALAPKEVLVQISMKANKAEDETKFKSCFCETVNHAREQWELFGKPQSLKESGKKNPQVFVVSVIIYFFYNSSLFYKSFILLLKFAIYF